MLRLALSQLRTNWSRFAATGLAVVVGVSFMAAGLMLTDAMRVALEGAVDDRYGAVDAVVLPTDALTALDLGEGALASPVDAAALAAVRRSPGVAAAAPDGSAEVQVLRPDGEAVSLRTQGRPWTTDAALNPVEVVDGRAPGRAGEVALDRGLAAEAGVGPGSRVRLATPLGARTATVVGTTAFGRDDAVDPGGTVSFSEAEAGPLLGGGRVSWDRVLVRTAEGAAPVADALGATLPGTLTAVDGDTFRAEERARSAGFVRLLRPVLQAFAFLSLFVCGFVIVNTFSVVVTQRTRELALARAVGATPGQVRRSLLVEGLVVGLVASALGLAAGAALGTGLQAVLAAFDLGLPGAGVRVTAGTVAAGMLVGTLLTVASVYVPAVRAGRTRPVEAMRTTAVDRSGSSPVRLLLGGAALALAVGLLLGARTGVLPRVLVAGGTLLMFGALVVGGPLLARAGSRVLALPMRLFGLTGRLAADNCRRNPRRTATTANALVIGLFLVTLVTVSGTAVRDWAVGQLATLSGSDYIVSSTTAVPDEVVAGVAATDGVAGSAPVRVVVLRDETGVPQVVSTTDFEQLAGTSGVRVADGSLEQVAGGNGVAVVDLAELADSLVEGTAADPDRGSAPDGGTGTGLPPGFGGSGPKVGSSVQVPTPDGGRVTLPVVATLRAKLDALTLGYLVGPDTFERLAGPQPVRQVFVRVEPGEEDAVGRRLDRLTRDYTTVDVQPGNFLGQAVGSVLDFLVNAVNALLGMSLFIALIGIVNTMSLAIVERRAELGMVRALGMTRGQVGAMVGLEALMLGALGTLVGVGAGLFLGWVLVGSLDTSIALGVDWGRVGLVALAGVAVGGLASVLPTRRATRVDALEAVRSA